MKVNVKENHYATTPQNENLPCQFYSVTAGGIRICHRLFENRSIHLQLPFIIIIIILIPRAPQPVVTVTPQPSSIFHVARTMVSSARSFHQKKNTLPGSLFTVTTTNSYLDSVVAVSHVRDCISNRKANPLFLLSALEDDRLPHCQRVQTCCLYTTSCVMQQRCNCKFDRELNKGLAEGR